MSRYLNACGGDTKKAMTLYRRNLQLSQELFTVISCFEIALRNAIDRSCSASYGANWLRDAAHNGGMFDARNTAFTKNSILDAVRKLGGRYAHNKLVAELGFGFWRYMFAPHQFTATGRILLRIFPAKPTSTPAIQYNHTYIFNELAKINDIRNRIAHHEPICFIPGTPIKDTRYVRQHYTLILQLFNWMVVDERALLYGLDHINTVCNQIDSL
ncbi:Abi family protein [Chitinophaga agri]|nr:Abi family protein [Chitinophaga agri]